ncbi:MAG: metal ABC transporter permease [Clostridiaceae bacterium]|jgi:zinc transport system permease protein|nr:metal ABC transporter permease [Clostridiaceae bacterium]HZJ90069.1 metal ABC transporter permease [Oscillospiraceae bacterium]
MLLEFLSYAFLRRALLSGLLISVSAALVGSSLVLKRYAMIGDGLSHVGFASLAIAMIFSWSPLIVALPIVILAAFLLLRISENNPLRGDAAVAMISSAAMAISILLISVTKGMNTDVFSFMFGSILSLSDSDMILSVALSVAVALSYVISYNKIFAVTFDETFAESSGISSSFWNSVLAVLAAVTIVLGMRMMGALLISSLIIFPPITAMRLFGSFKQVSIVSVVVSVAAFLIGIFSSYAFNLPTGPAIVIANILFFLIFSFLRQLRLRKRVTTGGQE